jgi:hypothetical protein
MPFESMPLRCRDGVRAILDAKPVLGETGKARGKVVLEGF